MYLIFGKVHKFVEEKNGSKSLVFDSTDERKEVFKKKQNFEMGLEMRLIQPMVVK